MRVEFVEKKIRNTFLAMENTGYVFALVQDLKLSAKVPSSRTKNLINNILLRVNTSSVDKG